MTQRYWRTQFNVFDFCAVIIEGPALQPEDVQEIAREGKRYAFRYRNSNVGSGSMRPMPDFPSWAGPGLLMSFRAAKVLLPVISPWTNVQSDVSVDDDPSFVIAIITETYDAVDLNETKGRYHQSGIWLRITELHLHGRKIGSSPIFCVPTVGLQWSPILSEEIVDLIHENGLTGLTLEEAVIHS